MGLHEPVEDWASDFDHTDDAWAADPFPIWNELRQTCPVAHSDRYRGVWLPTRHEDISAIAYDTERFTSRSVVVSEFRPPHEMAPAGVAPPISSDPPFHKGARRVLLPAFSPQAVDRLEPSTRAYCEELVDGLRGHDVVDAAEGYAQHIPVRVIAHMLGLPEADADRFRGFVNHVLEGVALPMEERAAGMLELFEYLKAQIDDHVAHPRDDLISYLLDAELDGEKLDFFHVGRTIALLLIAGIDTTWSAVGASLWHLAGHPADRERLVAEPELLPTAMEELLRAYAPVTMARLVREDMDFAGCPMKADDFVLLPFPAANRDPDAFDRADEVLIDREVNRHAAFGLGIHRCAGSHLARMEMRVALEVWLEAFPTFHLADPAAVRWSGGQVRGPRTLPLRMS
ncbi:MAG: cytochrome P450 [Actinomycetota bacterium]|nr:cytochrome P450 [Acidimicrobiia bacterium]MDQ3293870.1 cytochrome P450 [Actinomycetota bacterium]